VSLRNEKKARRKSNRQESFVALVCCAMAVALFAQIRRCAQFVLAAFVAFFAIELTAFFFALHNPVQSSAEKVLFHGAARSVMFVFLIALAAWYYKKSKASAVG